MAMSMSAVTYDFSASIPEGWTVNPEKQPNAFDDTADERGAQFTDNATITLPGVKDVSEVTIVLSANTAKNKVNVKVGNTDFGTVTPADKTKNAATAFKGDKSSGDLVITITRTEKSIYIKSVTIDGQGGDNQGGDNQGDDNQGDDNQGDDNQGDDNQGDDNQGDDQQVNATVTINAADQTPVAGVNGVASEVKFTVQGVTVEFGGSVNAADDNNPATLRIFSGQTMTISAGSNISKVVMTGKTGKTKKPDFALSASKGNVTTGASYAEVTEKTELSDPLIVVSGINAKSVILTPSNQFRVYTMVVYVGEGGGDDQQGGDDDQQGGDDDQQGGGDDQQGGNATVITYQYAEAYNYYDYLSDDGEDITIYLSNDPEADAYAQLELIAAPGTGEGATALKAGTYTISDTYAAGTAVVGGFDDSFAPVGCWVFGDGEEDYWDLDEGNVEVSLSGSTYTIKVTASSSSDGSKFVINYTGELPIAEGEFTDEAVENISVDTEVAAKLIHEGQLYIIRDGKMYNAVGARIK